MRDEERPRVKSTVEKSCSSRCVASSTPRRPCRCRCLCVRSGSGQHSYPATPSWTELHTLFIIGHSCC